MPEELEKNEDVIIHQQSGKIKEGTSNSARHRVSTIRVIVWPTLALLALFLWLMRLLGVIEII